MTKLIHNTPYYHETLRKFLGVFNSVFDGIVINKSDGVSSFQSIPVPISVGPKNKWLERNKAQPELKHQQIEMMLPRLSSEITEFRYAQNRKIGTTGTYIKGIDSAGNAHKIYNPTPYDATIQLYSMCKTQEESLQIMEQILPYFAPSLLIEFEELGEYGINRVVPVSISNVGIIDTYDGATDTFRTVTQTFTFTAKLDLFGPTNKNVKPILLAQSNIFGIPRITPQNRIEQVYADGSPLPVTEGIIVP